MDLIIRGHLVRTFQFEQIDSDLKDAKDVHKDLSNWLRQLDPRLIVRFKHQAKDGFWQETHSTGSLEIPLKARLFGPKYDAKEVLDSVPPLPWIKPAAVDLSSQIEPDRKMWTAGLGCIDTGLEVVGIVRIIKPAANTIEYTELEHILRELPKPFTLHTSVQRLSEGESQILLSKRLKQAESDESRVGETLASSAEDAIEETKLSGDSLFRVEILVEVNRLSMHDLKSDLARIYTKLSSLGTAYVETFGVMPSVFATLPGSWQHVPFFETGRVLPGYLPLLGHPSLKPSTKSVMTAHRLSGTAANIEIFSKIHLNANAIIVGSSGRGKSALVGKLTQSLLQDPNVTVFKVDVGGSHSRECTFFNGSERQFSLTEPSGLNPFSILKASSDEVSRSVLSNFLGVLLLEKDERSLTKTLRSKIEECVQVYANQNPESPSLADFYERCPFLPRRELLSRWVGDGIYAKAFTAPATACLRLDCQLRYFNFASIFDAADPEFAQAGMAAVLTEFNAEMRRFPEKRLVLICDETPFFIQRCFEFLKFTSANGRKFGNSLVLVVQQSQHLIGESETGLRDTTLIDNAHHKFLMSLDGDLDDYQDRFHLSTDETAEIESLRTIPREHSEFFYKFGEKGHPVRLKLTPEEYWRITTTKAEKEKIDSLMKAVPNLQLPEALRALAVTS